MVQNNLQRNNSNTNDIHIYTYLYWLQGTMLGSHDALNRVYILNTWQRNYIIKEMICGMLVRISFYKFSVTH